MVSLGRFKPIQPHTSHEFDDTKEIAIVLMNAVHIEPNQRSNRYRKAISERVICEAWD